MAILPEVNFDNMYGNRIFEVTRSRPVDGTKYSREDAFQICCVPSDDIETSPGIEYAILCGWMVNLGNAKNILFGKC